MPCRISVVFVLTVAMVLLAVVPAVVIWSIVFVALNESIDILDQAGTDSLTNLSEVLQGQLITKSNQALTLRLQEAQHVAQAQSLLLQAIGLTNLDLHPSPTLMNEMVDALGFSTFATMQRYPQLNFIIVRGLLSSPSTFPNCDRTFWLVNQALYFNLGTGTFDRAIYTSYSWILPDYSGAIIDAFYPDQVTGVRKINMTRFRIPVPQASFYPLSFWISDIFFNQYTGQVEIIYVTKGLLALNNTYADVAVSLNVQTMSDELRSDLQGNPQDRLFIFFRQPHGHMLAASHGKFYSMSDVDTRGVNPLLHPPNMSLLFAYTCLNSTDAVIYEACQQLYTAANFSWTNILEGQQDLVLNGSVYWVALRFTDELNCSIVHIKYRDSVMGPIEAKKEEAYVRAESWRTWTYVVLALAVFFAVLAALLMGCWLRRQLRKMSNNMERLGTLQFRRQRKPSKTVFAEMHSIHKAFTRMEQSLEAFARKVPGTARDLFRSRGSPDAVIGLHSVTVLYANVEGFAAACRNFTLPLVGSAISGCTSIITRTVTDNHGAIDKLIGDTIVATFNFPKEHGGHEGDAVESALAIQTAVYDQHGEWIGQSIPALRIRFGIQTGQCVIGDVDEGHRLCAGDAMKEAGKLEALNKTVGTYCLVSRDIYEATKHHIHFRQVFLGSDITTFSSSFYEPLCPVLPESPQAILDNTDEVFHQPLIETTSELVASSSMSLRLSSMSGTCPDPLVVYHYNLVKESTLLAHCRRYEQAYDQFLASEYLDALQTLREPMLEGTDPSWDILKKECTTFYELEGNPVCNANRAMRRGSLVPNTQGEDTMAY